MDILSKDTLALLRDAKLRDAIEEVLNDEDSESNPRVVHIQQETSDRPDARREPTEVTVRRVA